MFDYLRNRNRQIARQLQRKADRDRPAFSAGLHDRIMQTVRENPPRYQPQDNAQRRSTFAWTLAVAATVLVATSAVFLASALERQPVALPSGPDVAQPARRCM